MSEPTKPIACKACNKINFSGTHCSKCGDELSIVVSPAPVVEKTVETPQSNPQLEAADAIEQSLREPPAGYQGDTGEAGKKQSDFRDREKETARQKLKAKLKDARVSRSPLSKETEVLNKHGRRVPGARRIPVTQTAAMSKPAAPYTAM